MRYFKFTEEKKSPTKKSLKATLSNLLYFSFAKRTETRLDEVSEWLVEYNENEKFVVREIGLNKCSSAIIKRPIEDKSGYWTNKDLNVENSNKLYDIEIISDREFYQKWEETH